MKNLMVGLFVILSLFVSTTINAAEKAKITLIDGTVIRCEIGEKEIFEVVTKYGTLKIPFNEVRFVQAGYHLTEDETTIVKDAAQKLGSKEYKERDAAAKIITAIGTSVCGPKGTAIGERAYVILHPYQKSEDLEVSKRMEKYMEAIQPDIGKLSDVLITHEFTMRGTITNKSFLVKHASLGNLIISINNIDSISVSQISDKITIKAGDGWTQTSYVVAEGDVVPIQATGKVDLWPQQIGTSVCGPKGIQGTTGKDGWCNAGALIGKIGNAQPFFIGENSNLPSNQSGILYLKIAESTWNVPGSGQYHVTIGQ